MRARILVGVAFAGVIAMLTGARAVTAPRSCEDLASLALPHATVTLAQTVAAGAFLPPNDTPGDDTPPPNPRAFSALPAFCRVAATLKPSTDSDIKIEVWMPAAAGTASSRRSAMAPSAAAIAYPAMATALARGYATSSTDTGHAGGSASFALGHPEKVIDFGYRAVHEMTVKAKTIISAFYDDSAPKYSYWNGCSAGGRQALKEAQRFPADFDGIIAGAPGLDWTGRAAQAVRVAQALEKDEAARISADKARRCCTRPSLAGLRRRSTASRTA